MLKSQWLPYVALPAILGGSVLASCLVLSHAVVRIKSSDEIIRVTGSARKPMRSDFIKWSASVSRRAPDVASAYRGVTSDLEQVKAYLMKKGIPEAEIIISAITTTTLYERPKTDKQRQTEDTPDTFKKIEGYNLEGKIEVRSNNVALVDSLSRQVSELISAGVPIESKPPEYIYTKLSDLKVTMLAEAARDARTRAEQIAAASGCRVGEVRFAKMGILQITPIYSTEVSNEGMNDTSSLDKDITAIVNMGYSIR